MNSEHLKLDSQLCFPLYAASREITRLYNRFLDDLEITYPQYLVFLVLWEEKSLTVNQIGDKLFLDSGTLTPLLKRMEAKEFITRTRKATDERVVQIALTNKGEKLKEKAAAIPMQIFENLGLSIEEINILIKLTRKILKK